MTHLPQNTQSNLSTYFYVCANLVTFRTVILSVYLASVEYTRNLLKLQLTFIFDDVDNLFGSPAPRRLTCQEYVAFPFKTIPTRSVPKTNCLRRDPDHVISKPPRIYAMPTWKKPELPPMTCLVLIAILQLDLPTINLLPEGPTL